MAEENTANVLANHTNPAHQTIFALTIVSAVVNLLISLPLNSYVVWLITTEVRARGVYTEFFALHLALSDILFCFSSPLIPVVTHSGHVPLLQAQGFFAGFLTTARPLFQTSICVERYLAVVHPVLFVKLRPLRYRVMCSAVAWLIVLHSCLIHSLYPMITIHLWCVVGLSLFLIMLFCCLAILSTLKKPGPGKREKEVANQTKMRAFKIILLILVTTMLSYLPLLILLSLALSGSLREVQLGLGGSAVFSVTLLISFLQPMLYLHRSGKLPFVTSPEIQ